MTNHENIFELVQKSLDNDEHSKGEHSKDDTENTVDSRISYRINEFAEAFIGLMKKSYKFNIVKWIPIKKEYPKYILLGTDKGILAYMNFFCHNGSSIEINEELSKHSVCYELNNLVKQVALVYSDLDRPTFNIHFMDRPHTTDILYETTEQLLVGLLKEQLPIITFENRKYVFAPIDEMGTAEELIDTFQNLKKNNVRIN